MIELEKNIKAMEQVCLDAQTSDRISFALQQNGFPIIRSIAIQNSGQIPITDSALEISAASQFMHPTIIPLGEIGPGSSILIDSIETDLDYGYLESLSESLHSSLHARISQNGRMIVEKRFPIEILARNQWGGLNTYPESISAFVLPNDPAIDQVLGQAAIILQNSASNAAFIGYQRGKASVWRQLAAIWQALSNQKIAYALPPASFENSGQKVRTPSQILTNHVATCLDMSLLVAACIEQAGLRPLLIFTKGHACVGCWLSPEKFSSLVTDDVTAIRKRIALKEMLVFETTLLKPPAVSFEAACSAVSLKDDDFLCAIDICRTREQKIKPLTLLSDIRPENGQPEAVVENESIGEPPDGLLEDDLPGEDELSTGQPGRLELWQRKLLDLSLRNNLLNFRPQKRSVPLIVANPPAFEDMLADGDRFMLESGIKRIASQMLADSNNDNDREKELLLEQSRLLLPDKKLLAPLEERELENRLVKLYRAARSALDEGGANILYLALGFLAWRPKGSSTICRAPLILLPVRLDRKNAKSSFSLSLGEDDARFNLTLLEMLRKDFGLSSLDCFESGLPQDAHGLDIPKIWKTVRLAIRDIEGWELEESVILSTFSFAKYLMWQDLSANASFLQENDLVKHLLIGPETPYKSDIKFIRPEELDTTFKPADLNCPLLADSSQLAAIASAAAGKDFVLIGPPGTGKSQTIANMIAQCLAENKTVLFVAEKTAALNVVHDRLKKIGLSEFCLEMHSNKANKTSVISHLGVALERDSTHNQCEWEKLGTRLELDREELNTYAKELHRPYRNGLTPYAAMGIIVRDNDLPKIELRWPDADYHDSVAYDELFQKAEALKIHGEKCLPFLNTALRHMGNMKWSPLWQKRFETSASSGIAELKNLGIQWRELAGSDIRIEPSLAILKDISALLSVLPSSFIFPQWIYKDKLADISRGMKDGLSLLEKIHELEADLSTEVRSRYNALLKLMSHMPRLIEKYKQFGQGFLAELNLCDWSQERESEFLTEVKAVISAGERLEKAAQAVASLLEIESLELTSDSMRHWQTISALLPTAYGHDWGWTSSMQTGPNLKQLRKAGAALDDMLQKHAQLQGTYDNTVFSMDLKSLHQSLKTSKDAWFWKRGKLQKQVLNALGCSLEDCEKDLPILVELAEMRRNLEQYASLAELTDGLWKGPETDAKELAAAINFADQLSSSLAGLPISARQFNELCNKIELYIKNGNAQLGPTGSGRKGLEEFAEVNSDYHAALAKLKDMVNYDFAKVAWGERRQILMEVLNQKENLQPTAKWQNFYKKCKISGLESAFHACEQNGKALPGGETARFTEGEINNYLGACATSTDREILETIQGQLDILNHLSWLGIETDGLWNGYFTNTEDVKIVSDMAAALVPLAQTLGADKNTAYKALIQKISANSSLLVNLGDIMARFENIRRELIELLGKDTLFANQNLAAIENELDSLMSLQENLAEWSAFLRASDEAAAIGLEPIVNAFLSGNVEPHQIESVLLVNYCRWWIMAVIDSLDALKTFTLSTHEHKLLNFKNNDEKMRLSTPDHIASLLPPGASLKEEFPDEAFTLSRELLKKKRQTPLRQLLSQIPNLMQRLTPCLLMSPLSVAQYLEAGKHKFDVVIFDEASQVPVWDAIGAMARGKRIVVAGDPKQLPPTNFFQRGEDEDFDGSMEVDAGMESILDECRNVGVPDLPLRWHYRSRFENLIEFSNRKYYDGALITFPASSVTDDSVKLHYVDGIYERGGSRSNPLEAEKLVEDVVRQLRADANKSIGIVTFNMQQQQLIEDMLEDMRRKYPDLERFFGAETPEPIIVKNLENIQGDERDLIYFSICFAPDKNGNLSMNFGALSREGGERRLNVAITRARYGLRVFSSIRPEQISLSQTRSIGARDLRQFLEFAEKGAAALGNRATKGRNKHEAFEEAVAASLRAKGWQTQARIGASEFGVDVGVFNPDDPSSFLAGVECDGAVYRNALTTRDRDRLQEIVLNNLGWNILRVWSTDWWLRKETAIELLHEQLNQLLAETRAEHGLNAKTKLGLAEDELAGKSDLQGTETESPVVQEEVFAHLAPHIESSAGEKENDPNIISSDLQEKIPDNKNVPDEMKAFSNMGQGDPATQSSTIKPEDGSEEARIAELVMRLVSEFSPIHINDLTRQIAASLGYKRYGKRIQAEVQRIAESLFKSSVESAGTEEEALYLWADGQSPDNFILPRKIRQGRKVEEISLIELVAIAKTISDRKNDPISILASKVGIKRIHDVTRKRLEIAWNLRINP